MELDFVAWLEERLPASPAGVIGVGDDAALIDLRQSQMVVTTDLLIDGVHFSWAEHAPERIGRKSLAASLSDLAAMAAQPVAAVVSLAIPRGDEASLAAAKMLTEGMLPLAERFGCPIVGGDTNTGPGPLTISVTAFGKPTEHGVLRRSDARPGHKVLVTGTLGGSILGKHLDFTPRVEESLLLKSSYELGAGMDVTDGLAIDLGRLTKSSGVGAVIEKHNVPVSDDARTLANETSRDPLEHALSDGEDFELLLTAEPGVAAEILQEQPLGCAVTEIGEVVDAPGLWLRDNTGATEPLEPLGYHHH